MILTDLNKLNKKENILAKCEYCNELFYIDRAYKNKLLNPDNNLKGKFCSKKCFGNFNNTSLSVECKNCKIIFYKVKNQCLKHPNHFCTKSCAATHNNTHKTKGNRKSKLEIWLEKKLTEIYPNLEIHFNKKDTINSELDIYFPSLKLAVELNGIFHYEPIYGKEKLSQIQNNDDRKFQACLEKGIELVIIDTSSLKYFKESNIGKYANIIFDIINKKFDHSF